jgi:hypothetical protein
MQSTESTDMLQSIMLNYPLKSIAKLNLKLASKSNQQMIM